MCVLFCFSARDRGVNKKQKKIQAVRGGAAIEPAAPDAAPGGDAEAGHGPLPRGHPQGRRRVLDGEECVHLSLSPPVGAVGGVVVVALVVAAVALLVLRCFVVCHIYEIDFVVFCVHVSLVLHFLSSSFKATLYIIHLHGKEPKATVET